MMTGLHQLSLIPGHNLLELAQSCHFCCSKASKPRTAAHPPPISSDSGVSHSSQRETLETLAAHPPNINRLHGPPIPGGSPVGRHLESLQFWLVQLHGAAAIAPRPPLTRHRSLQLWASKPAGAHARFTRAGQGCAPAGGVNASGACTTVLGWAGLAEAQPPTASTERAAQSQRMKPRPFHLTQCSKRACVQKACECFIGFDYLCPTTNEQPSAHIGSLLSITFQSRVLTAGTSLVAKVVVQYDTPTSRMALRNASAVVHLVMLGVCVGKVVSTQLLPDSAGNHATRVSTVRLCRSGQSYVSVRARMTSCSCASAHQ
jgi:hypothetical protein